MKVWRQALEQAIPERKMIQDIAKKEEVTEKA